MKKHELALNERPVIDSQFFAQSVAKLRSPRRVRTRTRTSDEEFLQIARLRRKHGGAVRRERRLRTRLDTRTNRALESTHRRLFVAASQRAREAIIRQ